MDGVEFGRERCNAGAEPLGVAKDGAGGELIRQYYTCHRKTTCRNDASAVRQVDGHKGAVERHRSRIAFYKNKLAFAGVDS